MLANRLKKQFFDSDKEIEAATGANIPWIFDVEGEEGFRERETQALEQLVQKQSIVLATGGGIIQRHLNRELLSHHGMTVYLKTSIEQQLLRTAKVANRPLLQHDNPKQVLTELLQKRDPLYLQTSDVIIETDGLSPRKIVDYIIKKYRNYNELSNT